MSGIVGTVGSKSGVLNRVLISPDPNYPNGIEVGGSGAGKIASEGAYNLILQSNGGGSNEHGITFIDGNGADAAIVFNGHNDDTLTRLTCSTLSTTGTPQRDVYWNHSNGQILASNSSRKLKENIRDLEMDSSKIFDLRAVSFQDIKTKEESIGFIAEEVDEYLPELCTHTDGEADGFRSFYFTTLLIKEVQELNKRIKTLEEEQNKEQA